MANTFYPITEDKQIEKFIAQFMRVFVGFQYDDGDAIKPIRVIWSSMDRVVAALMNNGDHFNMESLPVIGVSMSGIQIDTNGNRSSVHVDDSPNYVKLVNGDSSSGTRRMIGPAFIANMNVSIYAPSNSDLVRILEQVLLIFNPKVTIILDNNALNTDHITEITLTDIQPNIQMPLGVDVNVHTIDLNFQFPFRLRYPAVDAGGIIKLIKARILDKTNDDEIINFAVDEDGLVEDN